MAQSLPRLLAARGGHGNIAAMRPEILNPLFAEAEGLKSVGLELVRCFPSPQEFDIPIYLVARCEILRRPPARDLFEIAAYFSEHPGLLTGERG